MSNSPQLEFTETTDWRTEEVNREDFQKLCDRHMAREISMTGLQRPSLKDRWLYRVTYKILKP